MISIIIPVLNEEELLPFCVEHIIKNDQDRYVTEIIVADGGSTDGTMELAKSLPIKLLKCKPGRARQMNAAAIEAQNEVLVFVHADTELPYRFSQHICEAIDRGHDSGTFQLSFGHPSQLLRFYSWCTRFDVNFVRFGDQGLFVKRTLFKQVGGYREDHRVLEDNELYRRLKKSGRPILLDQASTTSPRRYLEQGILRLQILFISIYLLWRLGASQDQLIKFYKKHVKHRVPD
jgi:rSAM/selenodomain-associated transferase 2